MARSRGVLALGLVMCSKWAMLRAIDHLVRPVGRALSTVLLGLFIVLGMPSPISAQEPSLLGYSVDELASLYVELALSREGDPDSQSAGRLGKWLPDTSVRILPQPSATLVTQYGASRFVDETKRISDILGSLVAHPTIVTFDLPGLEEFARQARLDGTGEFLRDSVVIIAGTKAELFQAMLDISWNNPSFPKALIDALRGSSETFCAGWNTRLNENVWNLDRGFLFIEYSETFDACLYEEIMQSFGIPQDFPDGTPSIFNDDNVYGEPTELDLLLWRVHGDPRLKAGMTRDEVLPLAHEIIPTLLK